MVRLEAYFAGNPPEGKLFAIGNPSNEKTVKLVI
jgi:hypothetical protein